MTNPEGQLTYLEKEMFMLTRHLVIYHLLLSTTFFTAQHFALFLLSLTRNVCFHSSPAEAHYGLLPDSMLALQEKPEYFQQGSFKEHFKKELGPQPCPFYV